MGEAPGQPASLGGCVGAPSGGIDATLGLDLAKQVFQLHAVDGHGQTVLRQPLKRQPVWAFFAHLSAGLMGLEACGGAHDWARELIQWGQIIAVDADSPVVDTWIGRHGEIGWCNGCATSTYRAA
jgi:hypothetical protein